MPLAGKKNKAVAWEGDVVMFLRTGGKQNNQSRMAQGGGGS